MNANLQFGPELHVKGSGSEIILVHLLNLLLVVNTHVIDQGKKYRKPSSMNKGNAWEDVRGR